MIVYFDGGRKVEKDKIISSYGVLLHNGQETPIEKYGAHIVKGELTGAHEYIAFLEAFKLLKEHNISYKKVSFYTDCEELVYAQSWLSENNFKQFQKNNFLDRLTKILKKYDGLEYKDEMVDCLLNCRFVKIKSHRAVVDNWRVDYTSKQAQRGEEPISYEKFLQCGFERYTKDSLEVFNLPFQPENFVLRIKI